MTDRRTEAPQLSNHEAVSRAREADTIGADDEESRRPNQAERDLQSQRTQRGGTGISNHPLPEEVREQALLPPRNTRKREHAAGEPGAEGAGAEGRLAGPRPPDRQDDDVPVMGVVPPDPAMPDEAGELDHTHGDARRVRENRRG